MTDELGKCRMTISLFAEDYGHEQFVVPLVRRLAAEEGIRIELRCLSVRGGFGRVAKELAEYVRALCQYREHLPDLVIVATDANCQGFANRRKPLQKIVEPIHDRVIFAVPDPHIERWLLLDPAAFKQVLGQPCSTPDQKCGRDRYKNYLAQAVAQSGRRPLFGGIEHAEDLVHAMDLDGLRTRDESLRNLLDELRGRLRSWGTTT